ncbi:MAG: hypothetical protein HGA45_37930 [Chloroflexales bacterium]|nr:hypothetical protein [Chloroflexales bacterium]
MTESAAQVRFPTLGARSLSGRGYTLPSDLDGALTVLVLAFQPWHQALGASWLPFLEQQMDRHPALRAYVLVIVPSVYTLARPFIDGGMIGMIADPALHDQTVTVYTDVGQLTQALEIPTTDTITVLLLDQAGRVRWHGQGGYDQLAAADLAHAIDDAA